MDELFVTYRLQTTPDALDARVDSLLLEQTVELPRSALHDADACRLALGRVLEVAAVEAGDYRVRIAHPATATADEPAQLMNVVFGNSSLMDDVRLEDVEFPESQRRLFGGPRFGIEGIRVATGVRGRALTCSALKPMGLSVPQLAELAYTLAIAGIDVIKDDHGLADHSFAPFATRVPACQAAVDRAAQKTGRRALYVPNLIGTPRNLLAQAAAASAAGVGGVMLSPMLVGLPTFHELVRDHIGVPVLAHPSFAGAQRSTPEAILGRIFPLFGADAVIFPSFSGRFTYPRATCARLTELLRRPPAPWPASMPVPAGGLRIEGVPDALRFYGSDTLFLVGGSILQDPAHIEARARRFTEEVQAAAVAP